MKFGHTCQQLERNSSVVLYYLTANVSFPLVVLDVTLRTAGGAHPFVTYSFIKKTLPFFERDESAGFHFFTLNSAKFAHTTK